MKKTHSIAYPTLLLSATVLVMSGACSQHAPGSYEGGGRNIPDSIIDDVGGNPVQPDSSVPPDVVVIPDTGSPQDTGSGNQG